MKISNAKRRKQTSAKVVSSTGPVSTEVDISPQIARAAAYLNATREQFVANAARAKQRLNESESGALAGPLARR